MKNHNKLGFEEERVKATDKLRKHRDADDDEAFVVEFARLWRAFNEQFEASYTFQETIKQNLKGMMPV
jgi:hypothetical protein